MRRTGSRRRGLLLLALLAAWPVWAQGVEFYQTVERTEVSLDDTFRLTVVAVDAPDSAEVDFPATDDFEVLRRSTSSERSISLGAGGRALVKKVQRYVLTMRARRTGTLTLPPATLVGEGRTWRTEPIRMTVRRGPAGGGGARAGAAPRSLPSGGMPADPLREEDDLGLPEADVPRSDADLFLRASVDRSEVYVGEQVTLSLHIYSRVDLSSVDAVTMPKLEGFWSEDVDSPNQLSGEQRVLNGVVYRAYLLRRRALFPVKPGALTISPAEADITTGFLFAGHRVHRVSNALRVRVRPLPPGAPAGFVSAHVGQWRLGLEVSQTQVELGQPLQVRVVVEGVGNVKHVTPPPLSAPPALKVYDPSVTDRLAPGRARVQGRRVHEYLVMPQATGTFTLPELAFPFFDPVAGRYEVARTQPVTLAVSPAVGGPAALPGASVPGPAAGSDEGAPKNVLAATGVRPLRYQARFESPAPPPWSHPWFLAALLAPLGLWGAVLLVGGVRGRLAAPSAEALQRRRARAARKRLAAAERLQGQGSAPAFYGEVEKALLHFLEARLGGPVGGLTRDALEARMREAQVDEARRRRVLGVLEACDVGRYAPGAETPAARAAVLDDAAAAMEGWDR